MILISKKICTQQFCKLLLLLPSFYFLSDEVQFSVLYPPLHKCHRNLLDLLFDRPVTPRLQIYIIIATYEIEINT